MAQVLSCEFYKIFKNTFFYRTPVEYAPEQTHFTAGIDHCNFNLSQNIQF